jgi:PknH-like extracellular domain
MRQLTAAVALAAIGISVAACGNSNQGGTGSSSITTITTTATKPPLADSALAALLLTPAEIDSALGVTGSKTLEPFTQLKNDNPADAFPKTYKFPDECLYVTGPAESSVYTGSGNTALKGERDGASPDPDSPNVTQFVVLFPSSEQASAFFTTSSQRWPACSNRQDTAPGDADAPTITWKVGPVSNANGVLSATTSLTATKDGQTMSESCQRALTVRNNVVIDTEACRNDPGDVAVNAANQIAGKVDKQ